MIKRTGHWLVFVSSITLLSCGVKASDISPATKLDADEARLLAVEAYDHGMAPEWFLDDHETKDHSFFIVYGFNPPPAEGGFGFFAVNLWTGDVWDLWSCRKLFTPALRRSRAAIKRRFTPAELKQYPRLTRLKPECI